LRTLQASTMSRRCASAASRIACRRQNTAVLRAIAKFLVHRLRTWGAARRKRWRHPASRRLIMSLHSNSWAFTRPGRRLVWFPTPPHLAAWRRWLLWWPGVEEHSSSDRRRDLPHAPWPDGLCFHALPPLGTPPGCTSRPRRATLQARTPWTAAWRADSTQRAASARCPAPTHRGAVCHEGLSARWRPAWIGDKEIQRVCPLLAVRGRRQAPHSGWDVLPVL
jgi:hypothetical protein